MSDSAALGFFKDLGKHPKGFWFIFWGELAERSSYYGMRAILALYMTDKLGFTQGQSAKAMAVFIGACYFFPLIGGWIADNLFGKYWTIVGFSIPYILGHLVLGIETRTFLLIALALLAAGTGVIKPNISTLMGLTYDQQRPGDEALRSDAFGIFYMAINIGAVISQIAMPYIRTSYSYQLAFAFPAALMIGSFILFAAGKKRYAVENIDRTKQLTADEKDSKSKIVLLIAVMGVIFGAITWASVVESEYLKVLGIVGFIGFATVMTRVLGRLGGIFVLVTFFWAIFDQSASTWIFFAKSDFNLDFFGFHIEPDAIQSINGGLVILLVPTFSIIWRAIGRSRGRDVRPTERMLIGFVLTAITMLVMGVAGFVAVDGVKVSIMWQAGAYVFLTAAEICISVVGLELAFAAAPKHMKSVVTACWLSCVAIANLCINAPITELYDKMAHGPYFMMLAGMMVPAIIIFVFVAKGFNAELDRKKAAAQTNVAA
jgi:POT family proton-dependent oligopeptide transporter